MSKTVEALQMAFTSDPNAIRALVCNRMPCNQMLADDPFVPVDKDLNLDGDHFCVGALGLVNAVLAANGLPLVATKWEHHEDGPNKFIGFCEYVIPQKDVA